MNIFNVMFKLVGVRHTGAVILFSLCIFSANAIEPIVDEGISIVDAWVRLTPPIAKNSAAYFTVVNNSNKDVTIIDVKTTAAETVAMHNTVIKQSMARMVHLKTLQVPAKGKIEFMPGGMHLMLVNLTEKLSVDRPISVVFSFDNGAQITSQMVVGSPDKLKLEDTSSSNIDPHQHHH